MGILMWVLVGALSGVIASVIAGRNNTIANLIVGIAGASLAGWMATWFSIGTLMAFNWINALIALGGAVVLLAVFCLILRIREA